MCRFHAQGMHHLEVTNRNASIPRQQPGRLPFFHETTFLHSAVHRCSEATRTIMCNINGTGDHFCLTGQLFRHLGHVSSHLPTQSIAHCWIFLKG